MNEGHARCDAGRPEGHINVDAAWRTRDPLTNLLGTDASIIQSETGLTNIELSLLDGNNESNNDDEGGGGHNQHTAESQFAASQVNIQSNILGPLLPNSPRSMPPVNLICVRYVSIPLPILMVDHKLLLLLLLVLLLLDDLIMMDTV